jgi:hypothetical protein
MLALVRPLIVVESKRTHSKATVSSEPWGQYFRRKIAVFLKNQYYDPSLLPKKQKFVSKAQFFSQIFFGEHILIIITSVHVLHTTASQVFE